MKKLLNCMLCDSGTLTGRSRISTDLAVVRCRQCSLVQNAFQFSEEELRSIYDASYYDFWEESGSVFQMKLETCRILLNRIMKRTAVKNGRVLDIGCAHGYMLLASPQAGFEAEGVEISPAAGVARKSGFKVWEEIERIPSGRAYEIIFMIDSIEHFQHPREVVDKCVHLLAPGGLLVMVTMDYDSWARRIMRKSWWHYKAEHLAYFSPQTLSRLLTLCDLSVVSVERNIKTLSLAYIGGHLQTYGRGWQRMCGRVIDHLPQSWKVSLVELPSGICVIGERRSVESTVEKDGMTRNGAHEKSFSN